MFHLQANLYKIIIKGRNRGFRPLYNVKYSVQLLKLSSFTAIVVFVAEMLLELST
jgi:hypothetical protein